MMRGIGKYGNCAKVAAMGVCSAHCPDGITTEVWKMRSPSSRG